MAAALARMSSTAPVTELMRWVSSPAVCSKARPGVSSSFYRPNECADLLGTFDFILSVDISETALIRVKYLSVCTCNNNAQQTFRRDGPSSAFCVQSIEL